MSVRAVTVCLWLFFASALVVADDDTKSRTGTICIAPIPSDAKEADDKPGKVPHRREPSYLFSVQIDKLEPVEIPVGGKPQAVGNLSVESAHQVRIRDDGELIESFKFTFKARRTDELCLTYTPWYQTWQLDPPRPGNSSCKCPREDPE